MSANVGAAASMWATPSTSTPSTNNATVPRYVPPRPTDTSTIDTSPRPGRGNRPPSSKRTPTLNSGSRGGRRRGRGGTNSSTAPVQHISETSHTQPAAPHVTETQVTPSVTPVPFSIAAPANAPTSRPPIPRRPTNKRTKSTPTTSSADPVSADAPPAPSRNPSTRRRGGNKGKEDSTSAPAAGRGRKRQGSTSTLGTQSAPVAAAAPSTVLPPRPSMSRQASLSVSTTIAREPPPHIGASSSLTPLPTPGVDSMRPTTPSVHIDWAADEDVDDLPDLDDWGVASAKGDSVHSRAVSPVLSARSEKFEEEHLKTVPEESLASQDTISEVPSITVAEPVASPTATADSSPLSATDILPPSESTTPKASSTVEDPTVLVSAVHPIVMTTTTSPTLSVASSTTLTGSIHSDVPSVATGTSDVATPVASSNAPQEKEQDEAARRLAEKRRAENERTTQRRKNAERKARDAEKKARAKARAAERDVTNAKTNESAISSAAPLPNTLPAVSSSTPQSSDLTQPPTSLIPPQSQPKLASSAQVPTTSSSFTAQPAPSLTPTHNGLPSTSTAPIPRTPNGRASSVSPTKAQSPYSPHRDHFRDRSVHTRALSHSHSTSRPVISPSALSQLTKSLSGGSRTHRSREHDANGAIPAANQ